MAGRLKKLGYAQFIIVPYSLTDLEKIPTGRELVAKTKLQEKNPTQVISFNQKKAIFMKFPNWIKLTPNTMHVTVRELWKDGRFYLRDCFINFAKKTHRDLIFHYKDEKYRFKPSEWMKKAKKMEKVELIPDCPMIRYGNFLGKHEVKEIEEVSVIKNLVNMPEIYRDRIRAKLGLMKTL